MPKGFVERLAEARIGATFNQYACTELCRDRLSAYLEQRCDARYVLVGEAAGYRGARVSGIPFTSERQLTGTARRRRRRPSSSERLPSSGSRTTCSCGTSCRPIRGRFARTGGRRAAKYGAACHSSTKCLPAGPGSQSAVWLTPCSAGATSATRPTEVPLSSGPVSCYPSADESISHHRDRDRGGRGALPGTASGRHGRAGRDPTADDHPGDHDGHDDRAPPPPPPGPPPPARVRSGSRAGSRSAARAV